jgi:predicted acyltransferase
MYVVHARRLQSAPRSDDGLAEAALRWLMWSEPFIAASFLFIVGFSLVLSADRHGTDRGWHRKVWRRAAKLYVLSLLLFVPQFGLQWPDLALSSGILSAIAIAIALVGSALATSRPTTAVACVGLAGWSVAALLEWTEASVSGANAGPGGAVPLVSFAAAGALLARVHQRHGGRGLAVASAAAATVSLAALLTREPWIQQHPSVYLDYGGTLALPMLLSGSPGATTEVTFWNHSVVGTLGLAFPLAASLALLLGPEQRFARAWRWLFWLLLLGRHALAAYVGHLLALGLLELLGWVPRSASQTWMLVGALAAGACGAVSAWERFGPRSWVGRRGVREETLGGGGSGQPE